MAKYCPEIVEKIAGYIADGNYASVACAAAGVSESVYYLWLKDPDKLEFLEAIKEAEAKAEMDAVSKIMNDDSWQSKAWYLERKFKDLWAKTESQNINHTGETTQKTITILKAEDEIIDNG